MLVAIPSAIALGALHSMEPGHGKGVMTAYLISSRARLRDAVLLGFTNALSHTFSILMLAIIATTALQYMMPQHIEAWLGLISGAVIMVIGMRMVYQRLYPPVVSLGGIRQREGAHTYVCSHGHVHHIHDESGHHDHHHHDIDHVHVHGEELPVLQMENQLRSKRRLLSIGVLTGLIPCPSALVMLLAAISAGQISFGISLVIAFSIGGAVALSLIGILILKAENKVRYLERRRFTDMMASASAMLIVVIGFLVTYENVVKMGWM